LRTSETTAKLTKALAQAQAEMKNAPLNKTNPHFKSKYADLAAVRDATVPALAKHGLALTQLTGFRENSLALYTRLSHADGEWIEAEYPLAAGTPQQMGSAMTYARRYCWAAICGIAADEDDDANAAGDARPAPAAKRQPIAPPALVALKDQWGAEYLLQPGEVEQWIKDAVCDATEDELAMLVEGNPGRHDVSAAVTEARARLGLTESPPPSAEHVESRPPASTTAAGNPQVDRGTLIADEMRKAAETGGEEAVRRVWRKHEPEIMSFASNKLRLRLEAVFYELVALPDDTDDAIAALEGRVEDARQGEMLG
jgi:hypothetical protein